MVGAKARSATPISSRRVDWESMLLNRAKDLAVGGKLALFNFGIDEEGRYLGATGGVNMFDTFSGLGRVL